MYAFKRWMLFHSVRDEMIAHVADSLPETVKKLIDVPARQEEEKIHSVMIIDHRHHLKLIVIPIHNVLTHLNRIKCIPKYQVRAEGE